MGNPVYQQVSQGLRNQLVALHPGDKFLTEREISEQYNVSRTTANKAVSSLVAEGLLEFKKGIGTFVSKQPLSVDLRSLVSFTEKARSMHKKPSTRVLEFRTGAAGKLSRDICMRLQRDNNDSLYFIKRLRLADHIPVILEKRYIVAKYCPHCTRSDFSKSLYHLWTTKFKLNISGADQIIRAILIDETDAALLGLSPNAVGFLVQSVGYINQSQPLWWEQTLYRGDAYEFHNHLGRIQPVGPAAGKLVDIR